MDATSSVPRSTMTVEQQRRVGVLQVAKQILSRGYQQPDRYVDQLLPHLPQTPLPGHPQDCASSTATDADAMPDPNTPAGQGTTTTTGDAS